jgi:tetraacyldisaccharide 4'-kinase
MPPSEERFRRLALGRSAGFANGLLRAALACASVPYSIATILRNLAYDSGWTKTQFVDAPVISIGNLTVGGTGKTPMATWFVRELHAAGRRPALLSRGYRGAGGLNDEALVLASELPHTPHAQAPDRVSAAKRLLANAEADVFVLDDGFQHRRLGRDLDVVLLDATAPFGGDWTLPRGLLREPASGLCRAQAVILTRADSVSAPERDKIRRRAARHHGGPFVWAEVAFRPSELLENGSAARPLQALEGQRIVAFCGIGNPEPFFASLERLGAHLQERIPFPDHHPYAATDLATISAAVERTGAAFAVCTHKDAVKIPISRLGDRPLLALRIAPEFHAGEEDLRRSLVAILTKPA